MKKIFSWLISSALLLLLLAFSSSQVLAVGSNGDFENGTDPGSYITLNPVDTNITDWTVDSGSVDYIGGYWTGSNGPRSVDLDGLTQGSISQTLTTVVGATYDVSFDLSGNPDSRVDQNDPYYSPSDKVVRVSATGASSNDYHFDTSVEGNSLGNMKWKSNTYSFVATGTSTTLTFASQIPGAFGPAIDNISINETLPVPPAVCPEGTTQSSSPFATVSVDSTLSSPTPSVPLPNGTYLFVALGDWANRNDSNQRSDVEYVTLDNWATHTNGYDYADFHLGEGEFDLQIDGAFVDWGSYNSGHSYSWLYTGTGVPANFLIFDGYSDTSKQEPGWYSDNSGSLSVNIYSCDPNAPTTGTISGMKYNDLNRNGQKDLNEPGLAGWVIKLKSGNIVIDTEVTDANGNYTFANIAPGTYKVRETRKNGWKRKSINPQPIVITGGSIVTNVDFGNAKKQNHEREDTDKDCDRDEQFDNYYANHGRSNYRWDKDKKEHKFFQFFRRH